MIAFYAALWLFGWFETVWVLVMLPAMVLLLLAERRAAPASGPDGHATKRLRAAVGRGGAAQERVGAAGTSATAR